MLQTKPVTLLGWGRGFSSSLVSGTGRGQYLTSPVGIRLLLVPSDPMLLITLWDAVV